MNTYKIESLQTIIKQNGSCDYPIIVQCHMCKLEYMRIKNIGCKYREDKKIF